MAQPAVVFVVGTSRVLLNDALGPFFFFPQLGSAFRGVCDDALQVALAQARVPSARNSFKTSGTCTSLQVRLISFSLVVIQSKLGDLLRAEVKSGSERGKMIEALMKEVRVR